jgi:hypothetical protein
LELTLVRFAPRKPFTLGRLYLPGGVLACYTLEDPVREGPKVPGDTAIPVGRYEVILDISDRVRRGLLWSPRADGLLPRVCNVPGFTGIRIHSGNTSGDTEGCILVGQTYDETAGSIGQSRAALTVLLKRLEFPCWLTISNSSE